MRKSTSSSNSSGSSSVRESERRLLLQHAFVTEHPWIESEITEDDDIEKYFQRHEKDFRKNSTSTFLRKERNGAKIHALKRSRRRQRGGSTTIVRKRKNFERLPRIETPMRTKMPDAFTSRKRSLDASRSVQAPSSRERGRNKLSPPASEIQRRENYTRYRKRALLKPIERLRPRFPERLLFSDFFKSVPEKVIDSLGWSVTHAEVRLMVKNVPGLVTLRLRNEDATFDDTCMQEFSACRAIEDVLIENCSAVTTVGIDAFRRSHAQLKTVTLSGCEFIDDRGYGLITSSLRRLETLVIRGSPLLTDLGMKAMGERPRKYSAITTLVLEDCPLISDKGLLAILRGLGGLEVLQLSYLARISDLGFMGLISAVGSPVCPDLKSVKVAEMPRVTAAGVAWIASGCPNLRTLDLRGCENVEDAALRSVSEHCRDLRTLILRRCFKISDDGLATVAACERLETLDITQCARVTHRGIEIVVAGCPALATWCLVGVNQLTDETVNSMCCLRNKIRDLRFTKGSTTGVGRAAYFGAPRVSDLSMHLLMKDAVHLKVLHVSGLTRVTDKTVRQVARFCKSLEELHVSGCVGVTDKSLVAVARCCLRLRSLHANDCKGLTDNTLLAFGSRSIASSQRRARIALKSLHVGCCNKITDTGVEALAAVGGDLEVVNIKFCDALSVRSVAVLASRCPKLESLNLSGIESVTLELLNFVARRCPLLTRLNVRNTAISRASLGICQSRLFFAKVHDQGVQLVPRNRLDALRMQYALSFRKKNEVESVRRIQRCARAYLAHKASVAYFLKQAEAQKAAEDKIAAAKAEKIRRMNAGATVMGKLYRGWSERRRYRRMREKKIVSVAHIQRCWRGVLGRQRALRRREHIMTVQASELERKINAAIRVQRQWRGYNSRVNFRLLKGIRVFETRICNGAATTVQSLWRCNRARRKRNILFRMRENRRRAEARSATLLANCWRGFVARDITQQLREERDEIRRNASTLIQTHARRYQAQMRYTVLREKTFRAATRLQRIWRMRVSRKMLAALREARREYEKVLETMALRVQRAWRSRLARILVASTRYEMWQRKRRVFSAIRIQTCYRRYAAQRLREAKRKLRWQKRREIDRRTRQGRLRVALIETGAARKIQTWYRCFLERRFTQAQIRWRAKEAAINIQRIVRGYHSRRRTRAYRVSAIRSATIIQSMYRVRKARRQFFDIVHEKHLEQEERRRQLKVDLIRRLQEKQERLNRELEENEAALLIQTAARDWAVRREDKRIKAAMEAKVRERMLAQSQEKRGLFARIFGRREPKGEENGDTASTSSPKPRKRRSPRARFKFRIRPKRYFTKMKNSMLSLVSKSARLRMHREKLDRLAYSVFSSQKHLFNLDGIVEVKLTVGEEEREAFQQVQDKLRAQKEFHFVMLNGDFSYRPPKQPLQTHIWIKKEPGATNLVTSVDIVAKPVTKTVREFKAIMRSWESEGITSVLHAQVPFVLHLRRGGKDPITDMKISTRRLDEENLSLAGYTRTKIELQHMLYEEAEIPQKPFYLWLKIMNITRSKEQKRIAGVMKRQPWYNERLQHMMDYLSLTEDEVLGLLELFNEIDADGGGTVDMDELFDYLEEPKTEISKGFFKWIDLNDDGELDFSEYVHMLGTVCMLGKRNMFQIAFSMVDTDRSGYVDKKELLKMVQMLEPSSRVRAALLGKIDQLTKKHGDSFIKMSEFKKIVDVFPSLLYPIQRLQDKLMNASMGIKWWDRKRRDFAMARKLLKEQQELANVK